MLPFSFCDAQALEAAGGIDAELYPVSASVTPRLAGTSLLHSAHLPRLRGLTLLVLCVTLQRIINL